MSDDAFDLLELQLRAAVRRRTPPPRRTGHAWSLALAAATLTLAAMGGALLAL